MDSFTTIDIFTQFSDDMSDTALTVESSATTTTTTSSLLQEEYELPMDFEVRNTGGGANWWCVIA
ncbi:hypothetical protein BDQ17DRAFT_1379933 [Cyathus striatus]|nr:hypothetical protein BDQ17DRAFT_1379933 [Cyathus striatus]